MDKEKMIVHTWDEISNVWSQHELDLPEDCRDPGIINHKIGQSVAEDEEGDGWDVKDYKTMGNILIIEARSDRNHLCLIVVGLD